MCVYVCVCVCVYIYINLVSIIHMTKNKLVHTYIFKYVIYIPKSKKELRNQLRWSWLTKHNYLPKIITMSSCRLVGFDKKNLPPCNLLLSICSDEQRFAIFTSTNHAVQNCKGAFIIKETNNYQMAIISKINNNKYHDHTQLSINSTYT